MELQRLTEELLQTVTSLNRSCIPQNVQEHLKGENFLLSYLNEHGGRSTPGALREVLGVSAPRTAAMLRALEEKGMLHQVQVIDLSDAARITMRYMDRFDVEFLWDADFDYKLDYLAAVVDKLEANEKGTIDMTQEGKASFIPA